MEQKNIFYHAVLEDSLNGVIWDSVENYPLELKVEVLKKSVGLDARKATVTGERRFVLQR